MQYNNFEELHENFAERKGDEWDTQGRCCLTEEEEIEWVNACYDLFERLYDVRSVIANTYDDDFDGRPFEIIGRVDVNDCDYDLCVLTLYQVRMLDDGDEWTAYPEEVFFVDDSKLLNL